MCIVCQECVVSFFVCFSDAAAGGVDDMSYSQMSNLLKKYFNYYLSFFFHSHSLEN